MKRTGKTFIIITNDGNNHKDVFLTWDADGSYYTTVDCIDEIGEFDFHDTPGQATARAEDANSGTLFGWAAPMKVVELLNFDEAYNEGADPELKLIVTITFK